jgi:hypothetical protein
MIVILCEERSMRDTLAIVFARYYPTLAEGVHWQIIFFQGKADLEQNLSRKMRSWSYGSPHFIILRDNDGSDCAVLKERLRRHAEISGKPFHIRMVCQELESWFLGDLMAVEAAFPTSRASQQLKTAKFRNPDQLTNASDELARLTKVYGKTSKANAISPHLELERNTSPSFRLLFQTLASLFPSASQ